MTALDGLFWSGSQRIAEDILCRYGEVIFTGIFSQLVLPTSIHQLTGDNRCQNPDGPLNRKGSTLLPGAPVVLHASNTVNSTIFPSHHFANGRRMSQKLNAGQMNRPFFPFILRHHCMLMYHSPSRMSQSRSSFPVEYGCAVSRHNLPMSSGRSNMLSPDNVFIAIKPVDMRRGIDALTQYIQDELRSTWHEGAAFVFVNKARSRIKVLRWDKHGVWLCTRRLHKGSFRWPRANDAAWHLTPDEFNWLIAGVDWQQVKGHDLTKWVWQNEPELRPENTQNTLLTQ